MKRFDEPIYITRPILPDLFNVNEKLREIWDTKYLTNFGTQHKKLEDKLCHILKVPYLSLINNGTIALMIAIRALGIKGEVITTPFTFPATTHAINWTENVTVFCDIDQETLNLDANKIEELINPNTKGILAVHVFGNPCKYKKIQEIADKYNLKVIYDAAHAFGTEIDDVSIGNFGDITMYSFHATKLFHTIEGGALTYKDKSLKEIIDSLINFGIRDSDKEIIFPGINGKMNELQAGIGLLLLDLIEAEKRKRKKILKLYKKYLNDVDGITLANDVPDIKSSYQYFVIRINEKLFGKSRDYVWNGLMEYNIYSRKYFHPLCSDYSCYKKLPSSNPNKLPIANRIVQEVLALPFYGELLEQDVEKICDILKSFKY